jgi:hypothetical protein
MHSEAVIPTPDPTTAGPCDVATAGLRLALLGFVFGD